MANKFDIRIEYNRLPELRGKAREAADAVVRKTAFDVQAHARALAPVDTGALKNSIYVSTSRDDTYGVAVQAAKGANPKAEFVDEVRPSAPLQAIVGVAVRYGLYVEFGTVKMAARPFMRPAVEVVKPAFMRAMEAIGKQLR